MDVLTTEKIRLLSDNREEISEGSKALLFGEMLKRSQGIIELYESDLFHDAIWISEHINGPGPFSFKWIPREWGTWIGYPAEVIILGGFSNYSPGMVPYQINITHENSQWYAEFTRIELS